MYQPIFYFLRLNPKTKSMKRILSNFLPLGLFLSIFFLACEQTEDSSLDLQGSGATTGLSGLWLLSNGPSDNSTTILKEPALSPAHLNLQEDGKLLGHSSRNILGGTYSTKSNNGIKLSVTLSTRVADTPYSTWFMQGLDEADQYKLEDNDKRLVFKSTSNNALEMIFLRANVLAKPVLINTDTYNAGSKEEFKVLSVSQIGNLLSITASYGGGCVTQEPDLVWGKQLGKSLPPLVPLKLVLAKADNCEALLTKTWYFNLENLFKETQYDELMLSIEGLATGNIRVKKQ
jgi:heat shock protein HslJ